MAKIWQKNYDLHKLIETFTVGEDYVLDMNLVTADCIASLAHAQMLVRIGILTEDEYTILKKNLIMIMKLHEKGEFSLSKSDEDCHTAIENFLITHCGDAGKKIHTGRSRNDQVIAAIRVFSRDILIIFKEICFSLITALLEFAETYKNYPMPGRTHMQIAMPSSVGLWAGAFAEELIDDVLLLSTAYDLNNRCPLGSAASYGVPLPLDREFTSALLGFEKVQNNVLYVNNSRGKIESIILSGVEHVVLTLSKLAQDLILFSLPEFGYFSLPDELCSGSSIMPQKKNPDGLELLRAKSASISSSVFQLNQILRALPSGYNRDSQETKAPFLKSLYTGIGCVKIMELTIRKTVVNKEKLIQGFRSEIFATHAALDLVKKGVPFREAYRTVGTNLQSLDSYDPEKVLKEIHYTGTTGNLCLEQPREAVETGKQALDKEKERLEKTMNALLGFIPHISGFFLKGL
ncbi:MAG: argininosuccinate lyase [Spirochaetales bacterium]|nr:argininosuccinate lyase [Spirochaetales bacterium]